MSIGTTVTDAAITEREIKAALVAVEVDEEVNVDTLPGLSTVDPRYYTYDTLRADMKRANGATAEKLTLLYQAAAALTHKGALPFHTTAPVLVDNGTSGVRLGTVRFCTWDDQDVLGNWGVWGCAKAQATTSESGETSSYAVEEGTIVLYCNGRLIRFTGLRVAPLVADLAPYREMEDVQRRWAGSESVRAAEAKTAREFAAQFGKG